MKLFKTILVFTTLTALVSSCVTDLDPKSLGPNSVTSADAYKTTEDYRMGLAKLYSSFVVSGQGSPDESADISNLDGGFGVYLRQYWNLQELPTDEAVYTWAEDGGIRPLHWQTWNPTNTFIGAMYTRLMLTVAYCNEFIRASATSTDADVKKFHAEARFLRALAYYHALDFFGNPPFVTEADIPGSFFPKQTNQNDLFNYIESELTAVENEVGAPRFEYARADQGAVWMLQAKLYLNAQTYIQKDKYTECLTAINKVLSSGKYSLATDYLLNFRANNNTSPEMIFAFNHDAIHTQSYGGMDYIIQGQIGGSMIPADFGVLQQWAQNRVTPSFVAKFPDVSGDIDSRAQFYTNGQELEINDVATFTDGYAITKFKNLNLDGTGVASKFVDTDYPLFRLADTYLMYAEAVLRGGSGGSFSQALDYVNALRLRAYGDASGNIGADDLTKEFLLDERARELYWEGHRRTDLIRYGLLTGGDYLWSWKGNSMTGAATDTHLNLFPIPTTDMSANPTLEQNPGYPKK